MALSLIHPTQNVGRVIPRAARRDYGILVFVVLRAGVVIEARPLAVKG